MSGGCAIEEDEKDGGAFWIIYETATDPLASTYLKDRIKVEFGGTNVVEPQETHSLTPYAADFSHELEFPIATGVRVLSAIRTFWEKVSLIHLECQRPKLRERDRLSRHWYDVY